MKYHPKTIYNNFVAFKDDAFFNFKWYHTFEFIRDYLFSSYYKDPENYLWYLER